MIILLIIIGTLIAVSTLSAGSLNLGGILVSDKVKKIAEAFAKAEGFGTPGALPTRAHNPGDLELGDIGNGVINSKTVFASDQDGWNALYKQVQLMLSGGSAYYSPSDSWRSVANTWTGADNANAWANIVAQHLGVNPDSAMQEYLDA
jgi:hypothetical protein